MAEYASLKVPELKKLLGERGLTQTGNKADLIARLQEHDEANKGGATKAAAEDEIDWDDEQPAVEGAKASETDHAPAASAVASASKGSNGVPAAPTESPAVDASASSAPETEGASKSAAAGDETADKDGEGGTAPQEEQTEDNNVAATTGAGLSQHLAATDADEEAKKRAARAKRFGIVESEEDKKKAERAERFGVDQSAIVKGLDAALPDRPRKRGRAGDNIDGDSAGSNKRATPDRRNGDGGHGRGRFRNRNEGRRGGSRDGVDRNNGSTQKRPSVLDNPEERRKAEARAKRFAS